MKIEFNNKIVVVTIAVAIVMAIAMIGAAVVISSAVSLNGNYKYQNETAISYATVTDSEMKFCTYQVCKTFPLIKTGSKMFVITPIGEVRIVQIQNGFTAYPLGTYETTFIRI